MPQTDDRAEYIGGQRNSVNHEIAPEDPLDNHSAARILFHNFRNNKHQQDHKENDRQRACGDKFHGRHVFRLRPVNIVEHQERKESLEVQRIQPVHKGAVRQSQAH